MHPLNTGAGLVLRTANCSPVDHPKFIALRALKPVADFCRPVLVDGELILHIRTYLIEP
jgi:hypothetical protein